MAYNYLQIQTTAPRKGIKKMTLGQLFDLAPYTPLYRWAESVTDRDYMDSDFLSKNEEKEIEQFEAVSVMHNLDGTSYESEYRGVASIKVKLV